MRVSKVNVCTPFIDFDTHTLPKALLVIVGCLVSKVTPGLVVSTVVMVVMARKVRLVLKVSLVRRVPRVYKVWLAHAENVVTMVMMVLRVPQDLKVWLVKTVPQVLVENVVFQV